MTVIYAKLILSILTGGFMGLAAVTVFNRMPAGWLCDVGEDPRPELTDPQVQRVKGWPWRWVYAGLLACLCVRLAFTVIHHPRPGLDGLPPDTVLLISQSQFALAGLFACWAMLLIGLADLKYMIVPDQLVILLAVCAMGFWPFHESVWQPLAGMAIGGGMMLLVGLMGRGVLKREALGFGDVKLCAAMGLVLGIRGILFVLITASLCNGLAAAIGLARKKLRKEDERPLGPWLCAAGIFYVFIVWPFMI